jgi:hypothetical protein
MESRSTIVAGGISFIVGALAFVLVFSYLAANFSYPDILDGHAAEVLPRLRAGGDGMRAVWALYALLPLLLVPGAVAARLACPAGKGPMSLALVAASIGALAMCLGLMRWPSIHWALAEAYDQGGLETRASVAAVFDGLNVYLGNYIGEFLGEFCLNVFFLLTGLAMRAERRFPGWLGWGGMAFGLSFAIGALRNICAAVQPVAEVNNFLLPLWMIVLGASMIWYCRREYSQDGKKPRKPP